MRILNTSIAESAIEYYGSQGLWEMRDKLSKKILNVSYSIDGLKWTTDEQGKLLYYNNAYLHLNSVNMPIIKGDTRISRRVIIKPYKPQDHSNAYLQRREFYLLEKADKMLYRTEFNY